MTTSGCADAGACTLAELLAGGDLAVDGVDFSAWSLVFLDAGLNPVFDASQVRVVGVDDDPFGPGLEVEGGGQLGALDLDVRDLILGFEVASGQGLTGAMLELGPVIFGGAGAVGLVHAELFDPLGDPLAGPVAAPEVFDDQVFGDQLLSQAASLAGLPLSPVTLETFLLGGPTEPDTVLVESFRFLVAIPEPGSGWLLALGVAAAWLCSLPTAAIRPSRDRRHRA